ncbi:MAG TPA: trypsin-like serine protease [Candidatus Limnocylindrales bacterium]
MKKHVLRTIATLAMAATLAVTFAAPASAITGGERDGANHPNVGLILFYDATGRYRCSATLVSPTIVLTAAHCTIGTLGKTGVTFKSDIAEQAPSPFPPAAHPSAGYTAAELAAMGMLSGTAYTHPKYSDFTDLRNWNDVGLIVLDAPVVGITAASLPPRDFLGAYAQPKLNSTLFTVVGYGTEVRKPDSGPQKPQPMSYPLVRRVTTSPGQKLTTQILQLNGNINDTRGGGGTCFGDSGGPVFLNGYLVADTSYGYTDNCRYLGGYQRLDIKSVQDWLATYGL